MRLLDLFCGAGGCAVGYHRAGFTDIVGVDVNPQPRYPFQFFDADALDFLKCLAVGGTVFGYRLHDFDAIHASPPCQAYSTLASRTGKEYPELVRPTRQQLLATGLPYVIENVVGAPLVDAVKVCGSAFNLGVRRHRLFESNKLLHGTKCRHDLQLRPIDVSGTGSTHHGERKKKTGGKSRKPSCLTEARAVMGIDWMERRELSQAIPPAYTEFIGKQLIDAITSVRVAS